jgi:glyoxylase-like metal-dependent hydrolase (beta-lactamase superfamily II)
MTDYSLWLVEYGKGKEQAWSWMIAGEHNKGVIENVPFTYLVGRGEGHTFLIDVGFDDNPRTHDMLNGFGVIAYQNPRACLGKLGFTPEDVDTVFLTHLHFDHAGNTAAFPNAKFYLQQKELFEWLSWLSLPKQMQYFSFPIDKQNIIEIVNLVLDGRCELIHGERDDILSGVQLIPAFDTHSFGMQFVGVESAGKKWVCVSDNAHEYQNYTGVNDDGIIRPVSFLTGSMKNAIMSLNNALKTAGSIDNLIIFHAQGSFERFPTKTYPDGLRIAELVLAKDQKSLIE